jgi:tetratricopeptide (TPR) repeat protein
VDLEPEAATGSDRQGRLALTRGEWPAAQTSFLAALAREPEGVGRAYRLGEAYWGQGAKGKAEEVWQDIAAAVPDYAPARRALGRAHRLRREWEAAAAHLMAAVQSGGAPEAQWELARVMEAMGRSSSATYQRGVCYLQTDRPHQALAVFRKLAAAQPDSPQAALMVSFCWMQLEQNLPAIRTAQAALRRHPKDPALRQRVVMLHLLTGNRRAAAKLCREWREEQPQAAEPHRLLGRAAFGDLRLAEALTCFEKAASMDPSRGDYFLEMGEALLEIGNREAIPRAEIALRRAVALEPARADHHLFLGLALQRQGKLEEARQAFLHALDREGAPGGRSSAAAGALVRVATALRQPAQARLFAGLAPLLQARHREGAALRRDVHLRPHDPAAHERLAHFLSEGGDLRRAMYQWEQGVELDPTRAGAAERLKVIRRVLALQEP